MSYSAQLTFPLVFFYQSSDYSCGPAVARAALATLVGISVDESELVPILETNSEEGTRRPAFERLAGFQGSSIRCHSGTEGSFDGLEKLLLEKHFVLLNYREPEEDEPHWASLLALEEGSIILADPWHGSPYKLSIDTFYSRWRSGELGEEKESKPGPGSRSL